MRTGKAQRKEKEHSRKSLHSRPEPELPFGSMPRGTKPAGDRLQSLTFPCRRPLMLRILYDLPAA